MKDRWLCRNPFTEKNYDLSQSGLIMGIVNVTPDSFSDGGHFLSTTAATEHALEMMEEGADILDVGGESTRPGAAEVSEDDELERVIPVIKAVLQSRPDAVVSIDTSKAAVAKAAIEAGALIINDVTGLTGDPDMIEVVARTGAGVVVMHMQGSPRTMQKSPQYQDVVKEVSAFFRLQFEKAVAAGIRPESIVFDPGIGFGKTLEHNLELLCGIEQLGVHDRPVLVGVSRKSFIGKLLGSDHVEDREWPTVALTSYAREKGAKILRVHDAKRNAQALRVTEAVLNVER